MCNLGEGIREQAYEKGLKQGLTQGIEKGISQGRVEGLAQGRMKVFLNLIGIGMSKEEAQRLAEIGDDLIEKALSLQKS